MPPNFVDPYLDPDTGLLRNLLNIKSDKDLKQAEARATAELKEYSGVD